jgi:hypothetical protein
MSVQIAGVTGVLHEVQGVHLTVDNLICSGITRGMP